jgi:hypothetical protein
LRDLSRATRVKLVSVDVAPSTGEQHVRHLRVFCPPSYLDNKKFIIIIFFWLLVDYILSLLFGLLVCNKRKKKNREEDAREKRKKITEIRSKCF